MQRFVPVSQKNYFAKFCANLGSRISISKLLRPKKKEKTPGKDRIFSSCPRSVFRCGYHVFFSKILFVMLWILTHLSWLEFQTQYRGSDPSSQKGKARFDMLWSCEWRRTFWRPPSAWCAISHPIIPTSRLLNQELAREICFGVNAAAHSLVCSHGTSCSSNLMIESSCTSQLRFLAGGAKSCWESADRESQQFDAGEGWRTGQRKCSWEQNVRTQCLLKIYISVFVWPPLPYFGGDGNVKDRTL